MLNAAFEMLNDKKTIDELKRELHTFKHINITRENAESILRRFVKLNLADERNSPTHDIAMEITGNGEMVFEKHHSYSNYLKHLEEKENKSNAPINFHIENIGRDKITAKYGGKVILNKDKQKIKWTDKTIALCAIGTIALALLSYLLGWLKALYQLFP